MKIAVVGCGYWGKNLIRNFSELGVLAAVCDADTNLAQERSASYHVPALSFSDVLGDISIQGVVIAAPAAQHFDLAQRSLLAGKHVFVEKPLAFQSFLNSR